VEPQWPESHAEQTDVFTPINRSTPADEPTVKTQSVGSSGGETTMLVPPPAAPGETTTVVVPPPSAGAGSSDEEPADGKRKLRRTGFIVAAVFGVLVVLYGVDLLLSSGNVPRGVTVAGVAVGGQSQEDAERVLRDEIEPRLTEPVQMRAGDVDVTLEPDAAGMAIDWAGTLSQAGDQPLNPITRLTSFFSTTEVGVVTRADDAALDAAVEGLRPQTDREPAEGGVRFEGVNPVPIQPLDGQKLDAAGAREALLGNWATGDVVELPVKTTEEGVQKAIDEIATPAVSAPVVVKGEGKDATVEPAAIAAALIFEPDGKGGLTAKIDPNKFIEAAQPQLAETEVEGKDAEIVFSSGAPTVEPSVDGKGIDWEKSLVPLLDVLKKTEGREVVATYAPKPAEVTTEAANALGIKEVISEFTTRNFASDSGINIRTAAADVNGAIVRPGETFSLNGHTGVRNAAKGYVEAGIIENGAPGRGMAGGVSQFATTLYNASYFAGMTDVEHKEHSFYISRYPEGREATVFLYPDGTSAIDLKFKNDTETGVAIQTIWTSSSITVKLWGTKTYDVESVTSGRTNLTNPQERPGPAENCKAGNGSQGFTVTDTRIVRNAATGEEVSRKTRTVKYNPVPKIICGPPPPAG
jgi:vancomycin resistance protein YoaR